jgi:hypothetical protein
MTQGYITLASKSADDKQIKQAVLLASSLRLVDATREICLVVDKIDDVPQKYEDSFDSIIELPYGHYDLTEDIAINIWQIYYCSPFEETMYMDRRTLVTTNMDDIWESAIENDYVFNKRTKNYRGEYFVGNEQFFIHNKNNIPNYYTDVFYFGKNETTQQFFKMLDVVLKEFRRVYLKVVAEKRPSYFDLNLLINITIKLLGEETRIHGEIPYTLIGLDNLILDDQDLPPDWVDYLSNWVSDKILKIGNHRVSGIVCYNSEEFVTDEILSEYRTSARNNQSSN